MTVVYVIYLSFLAITSGSYIRSVDANGLLRYKNKCLMVKRAKPRKIVTAKECAFNNPKYTWIETATGGFQLANTNICLEVKFSRLGNNNRVRVNTCIPGKTTQTFKREGTGENEIITLDSSQGDNHCIFLLNNKQRNVRFGKCCFSCLKINGKEGQGVCTRDETDEGEYCKCNKGSLQSYYGDACELVNFYNNQNLCFSCNAVFGTCKSGVVPPEIPNGPPSNIPDEIRFYCECVDGYTGINCNDHVKLLTCESSTCQNGGTCTAHDNNDGFYCDCPSDYVGAYCHIGKCNACKIGGLPFENTNGDCVKDEETNTGEYCKCKHGLDGAFGITCSQTFTTTDSACGNDCGNGVCTRTDDPNKGNQFKSYYCACNDGFTGRRCEERVSLGSCITETCKNGSCVSLSDGNFQCDCDSGFTGAWCEQEIN